MQPDIGGKIRTLRKARRLTQEELADRLMVSAQTVSKWELGTCFPDVLQFPVIANYFGVTIDDLFCRTEQQQKERIAALICIAQRSAFHYDAETERMISEGLRDYPGNEDLLAAAAEYYAETIVHTHTLSEELNTQFHNRAVALSERVIAEGNDRLNICHAKYALALMYIMDNRYEDASAVIQSLPYLYPQRDIYDRGLVSIWLLKGDDKLREAINLRDILQFELYNSYRSVIDGYLETGNTQEAENASREIIDLHDTMWGEEEGRGESISFDLFRYLRCLYQNGNLQKIPEMVERLSRIAERAKERGDHHCLKVLCDSWMENELDKYAPIPW